jgi:hypothetical protein
MMTAKMVARYAVLAAPFLIGGQMLAQQSGAAKAAAPMAQSGGAAAAPPAPAHPATQEQVREYLALTGIVTGSRRSMESNIEAMQARAMPYYPASFWEDMRSQLLKLDLVAIYTPVLQRYLSQENMAAMLTFYRSPAGKLFLSVQPEMSHDAEMALRSRGAEVAQGVYAKHKAEIDAAKKKYEAEHPGAAK